MLECDCVCVCVSISVMGGNIDFKDIGGGQIQFIHHCCFEKWFLKQYWCRPFCHICFFSISLFEKSAVQYANVLFFKKCYCTVNIIVNIFVSS